MATRRRIGISAATTEAARRQLMQPVPCWEKVWVVPSISSGSSTLKVYKWIKTEKIQHFSDDEGEVDEPLAPLPDEPEVVDGDEDLEQDEPRVTDATQSKELTDMDQNVDDPPSKPQLRIMPSSLSGLETVDGLDASLKLDADMDDIDQDQKKANPDDDLELDISGLGPDGLQLESAHDLSQLDGPDGLMGGSLMDDSVDPFADTT